MSASGSPKRGLTATSKRSALLGAAFLMATSAIGPGFITQTTVFTSRLLGNFGFVILISILIDIAAQLNIWRVIAVSGLRAQELANKLLPGLGFVLTLLVVLGGIAFNIGNVGGAGLGMKILSGMDTLTGAVVSAMIAIVIFWFREAANVMDTFSRILGFVMIALTLFVAISSHPPVGTAIKQTFIPEAIDATAILTIVGGTVGGYISFAGAHRLLDADIRGKVFLPQVSKSSINAILLASSMRVLLFLATLGVVVGGVTLDSANPAADVFHIAAGEIGYRVFGVVLWSAAITSVVGAAYTSVSFLRSMHPWLDSNHRPVSIFFIIISTLIFALVGRPVEVLVFVGALNGFILPVSLVIILLAASNSRLVGDYKHPLWMTIVGWIAAVLVGILGVLALL